ncbi:hypothetical protein FS837_002116, partial [Tulasnella sp. UAMH 9824]
MQIWLGEGIREPERIKLSARDILNALEDKRIHLNDIKFFQTGPPGRGGNADVVVATLIRSPGVSPEDESREVAVKKFRFILSEELEEEKSLR